MANKVRITDMVDYLLTEFSGDFSVEAGMRCIDEMTSASRERGRSRVLLDCRKMSGNLSIVDRFEVASYAAVTGKVIARLALVNPPQIVLPDNFVENVAVNRGANVKVFTDFDEAVRWLMA